jgi:hypothetical protein
MIMQAAFTTHRPMASEAGSAPATPNTIMPSHDMRRMGLETASRQLHANVGDLGEVFEARAKADIFYCPVCPEPHAA